MQSLRQIHLKTDGQIVSSYKISEIQNLSESFCHLGRLIYRNFFLTRAKNRAGLMLYISETPLNLTISHFFMSSFHTKASGISPCG